MGKQNGSPEREKTAPRRGVRRDDGDEDEEGHEVEVRGQVGHELDHGHLVEPPGHRHGEEEPDGRDKEKRGEEEQELDLAELEVALPDLLEILLHHVLRDGDLLLVLDQRVDEAEVVGVEGVEDGARVLEIGR